MLYTHQDAAGDWLAGRDRGYLGDTPGLGKTRSLITGLYRANARRPLVVCPAIVRSHWVREFNALHWDRISMHRPIVRSYDEITRGGMSLMAELVLREQVDSLVLDEAHYCKHADAQRTRILLGKDGYARRIPRVYAASGTPMPKHPGELWTVLCTLFPEAVLARGIRTYAQWMERFCVTVPRQVRGKWIDKVVGVENESELQEILSEVMLRRTLDDVGIELPKLWWQVTALDIQHPVGVPLEGELIDSALLPLIDTLRAGESLEAIASDPHVARMRRRIGELKVTPVVEMLRSQLADSDEKVVIFAHHRSVLERLRSALGTFGVAYVDGDTPDAQRITAIDRFQTDARTRLFVGQNIACQTGITLTAARRVVLVEPDWTAVVNEQLGHRVARIGQTAERCVAQMIALAGTLDEAIVRQNEREVKMAAQVLGRSSTHRQDPENT